MTYIKPETANQSFLVRQVLDSGLTAARQQDWLEVSNQLKLLPQSKSTFLLEPEDWHTAFHLALRMLAEADFQHKWEITKLLPLFGEKIIEPLCDSALDETIEVEVRWFICKVLGKFPHQKVILTLVKLLQQTTDSQLIDVAEKTLIEIGDRAVAALIDLLSQPEQRVLAVRALSYIRTSQTIAPLLEIATTAEEPELRTIAIAALSSFHDARILPVAIAALQDRASSVRKEAAIALGFRCDLCQEFDLITQLQPLLYDLDLEVCRQTAIALGRMKQLEATTALYDVLQADTTPVSLKLDLIKALAWSENASAIDYLKRALNNASELVVREIITVLGRTTTSELKPVAARVLIDFWQNNRQCSSDIKQMLATSLGQLRCNFARQILEEIAQDRDRKVKLHALSALRKLSDASN